MTALIYTYPQINSIGYLYLKARLTAKLQSIVLPQKQANKVQI